MACFMDMVFLIYDGEDDDFCGYDKLTGMYDDTDMCEACFH
jgi:hypothetical protein